MDITFDAAYCSNGQVLCGVDEAGRGPLAGAVFAAAVVLNSDAVPMGLDDSKKLSAAKRERLEWLIQEQAVTWAVASASVAEIEEMNILRASMLAMERAVGALAVNSDVVLVDGNRVPVGLVGRAQCIVKGDALSPSIAAASILAKVARDRYMLQLAEMYPQYGFERHKGYGTEMHFARIREHGVCEEHRRSFLRKKGLA